MQQRALRLLGLGLLVLICSTNLSDAQKNSSSLGNLEDPYGGGSKSSPPPPAASSPSGANQSPSTSPPPSSSSAPSGGDRRLDSSAAPSTIAASTPSSIDDSTKSGVGKGYGFNKERGGRYNEENNSPAYAEQQPPAYGNNQPAAADYNNEGRQAYEQPQRGYEEGRNNNNNNYNKQPQNYEEPQNYAANSPPPYAAAAPDNNENSYGAGSRNSYGANENSYGAGRESYGNNNNNNNYNSPPSRPNNEYPAAQEQPAQYAPSATADEYTSNSNYAENGDSRNSYSSPAEIVEPFPGVKPYFDTYYCSVHGSFALAFTEKVANEATAENYGSKNSYAGGDRRGENAPGYKRDIGHKLVRKVTRQYCRYTAAWSHRACEFCCRVVARSVYTNPDDIIAAIFSFDPRDPASGGAGVQVPTAGGEYEAESNSNDYSSKNRYAGDRHEREREREQSYGRDNSRYNNGGGYESASEYRPKRAVDEAAEGYGIATSYESGKATSQCLCCAPKHRYY